MNARILVVESAMAAGIAVQHALLQSKFDVEWVADAEAARRALSESKFRLGVFELGTDWAGLLDELRGSDTAASSMLAVGRWAVVHVGTNASTSTLGCGDLATATIRCGVEFRVRALLEELGRNETKWESTSRPAIELLGGRVALIDGMNRVKLSPKEYTLLAALMARPGAIVSHESLMGALRRWEESVRTRTVEAHVSGLRRKVGPGLVENVRGVGYRVCSDSSDKRLKSEHPVALRVSHHEATEMQHAPTALWTYFDLAMQRSVRDESAPEIDADERVDSGN